jgi:hypothetical protein
MSVNYIRLRLLTSSSRASSVPSPRNRYHAICPIQGHFFQDASPLAPSSIQRPFPSRAHGRYVPAPERQPLGYAMVGGLIVSQALTLFTTPVVYLYLDRLSNWFSGWGRSGNVGQNPPAGEQNSIKQAAE